jgi:biotin carboxylase
MEKKDIILFVNNLPSAALESFKEYKKATKQKLRIAVIRDSRRKSAQSGKKNPDVDIQLSCDLSDSEKIAETLLPYHDEIKAVTCRGDAHIDAFKQIIPNVPYLRTPTSESLDWSVDKIKMRKRFHTHDKSITPKFMVVKDAKKKTLTEIAKKIKFPLIIKPANLVMSMLVTKCYHEEELEKDLKKVLRKAKKVYAENGRKGTPQILVEEFIEGEMYSVDAYVTARGKIYFLPLVHVTTGKQIGRDDFYSYKALTPTTLRKPAVENAEAVAKTALKALGLRSSTAHIELMKTDAGWKVVEIGPRIGGFRHDLYRLAFGVDHGANDIRIRIPEKPVISKKRLGHACAMKFYPEKEGVLTQLKGIKKIHQIKSVKKVKQNKKVGDKCLFAKHGGVSVVNVILFNKERSKLLADMRRIEKSLTIVTK